MHYSHSPAARVPLPFTGFASFPAVRVGLVSSRGVLFTVFSLSQFARARSNLERLGDCLFLIELGQFVQATASNAPAHGKRSAGAGAGRVVAFEAGRASLASPLGNHGETSVTFAMVGL